MIEWGSLGRYRRVALLAPLMQLAYRADAIVDILMIVSRVFLFFVLWSAIYRPGQVAAGFGVHQAITYSTLAALLVGERGFGMDTFADHIRDGTIVYLFLRPLSPIQYYWGLNLGAIGFRFIWIVVGAAIGAAAGVVAAPASVGVLAAVIASVLLAELIYGYFFLFLQLMSFWTIDITGARFLYFFVIQVLSGALVPIWFFPHWAQSLLVWTPFAAALSTPVSLYVGRIPASQALGSLLVQGGWLVVFAWIGELLWHRVEHRVVVQGG